MTDYYADSATHKSANMRHEREFKDDLPIKSSVFQLSTEDEGRNWWSVPFSTGEDVEDKGICSFPFLFFFLSTFFFH